jgi:hypothetical protein
VLGGSRDADVPGDRQRLSLVPRLQLGELVGGRVDMTSATFQSSLAQAAGDRLDQAVDSNALSAASTARSTSAAPASAT